jgi:hypothetical protein
VPRRPSDCRGAAAGESQRRPETRVLQRRVTEDIISGARALRKRARDVAQCGARLSRGSARRRKAIREQLDVRYIVQGSVRERSGRLRVAVTLQRLLSDGAQLWSEQYGGRRIAALPRSSTAPCATSSAKLLVKLTQLELQRVFAPPHRKPGGARPRAAGARADSLRIDRSPIARRAPLSLRAPKKLLARLCRRIYARWAGPSFQRAHGWLRRGCARERTQRAEALARRTLALGDQRAHVRAASACSPPFTDTRSATRTRSAQTETPPLELNPSDWRMRLLLAGAAR